MSPGMFAVSINFFGEHNLFSDYLEKIRRQRDTL